MDCIGYMLGYMSAVFQVIPAKGHANVVLSFTPYPTAEVPKDLVCIGYMLGYMSAVFQVIPAKGHANVVLSFTPYPTAEVHKTLTV